MEDVKEDIKKDDNDSLSSAIIEWVFDELKETGQLFLDQLSEEQLSIVRETVENLVVFSIRAAVDKKNREIHLIAAQSAINTLSGNADLAVLEAQKKVRSAFQGVFLKMGGGFFS